MIVNQFTSDDQYTSIDDLFSDLTQKSGEPGVLLKGLRYREGLSQIEFAKKLNISQNNLYAMENGRRVIGKELAKRIADINTSKTARLDRWSRNIFLFFFIKI